tara:strand:- start:1272 stop:2192 length:921 start_codon:yes stop_codon:yes gene_type:complete
MVSRLVLLFLILSLFFSNILANENKIIVKIDNQIITSYELKNKILTNLILLNEEVNQNNINKNKKLALDSLINSRIKRKEFEKYNIDINKTNILSQLLAVSSNNINELKKKFEVNNLNYEMFEEDIKIEVTWRQFIFQMYNKKVKINEKEIDKQIDKIKKNRLEIEEFRISEILISFNNETDKKNKISFINKKIDENGFDDTALRYSESSSAYEKGDLGWLNAASLSDQISKIISSLNVGDISPPIENINDVLFLKLIDKRSSKAQNINYDTLRENLINKKKNELFNLYSGSYLSKLRNNLLIEYK